MRPGGPGGGLDRPSIVDRAMTTRARRRLAVQTAAAVTSAVLLVGGAAWLLVGHEQRRDVDRQTAAAVDRADDVIDPPDDIYLFLQAAERRVDRDARKPAGPAGPCRAGRHQRHRSNPGDHDRAGRSGLPDTHRAATQRPATGRVRPDR